MKHIILYENFTSDIFEQEKSSLQGVALIYSSTSDTNVADALAQKMGVKKDVKYKITIKGGLDVLMGLSEEFPLPKLAESKKNVMSVSEDGKVAAGKDILKINDKVIDEKGKITLKKSDLSGKELVIEAANNGVLALYRLSGKYGESTNEKGEKVKRNDGMTGFYKTSGISLSQAADYVVSVELGTKDQRKNEWFGAWNKNNNEPITNTFYGLICSGVVLNAGGKVIDQLAKKYEVVQQNSSDSKKIAESINISLDRMHKSLVKRKFMVNKAPMDMKSEIETFVSDSSNYIKKGEKVSFTKSGIDKFLELRKKFIDFVCNSSLPEGFPEEASSLLPKASEIIKGTFGQAGTETPKTWLEHVQTQHQYAEGGTPQGQSGMKVIDFGEGKF